MEIIKKYKALLVLALVVLAAPVFLFVHFYQNDTQTLTDYSASYQNFDEAIAAFSGSPNENSELENNATEALDELQRKAGAFRLSSLVENDAKLMDQARAVADLSAKELESLTVYKRAVQSKNANLDQMAKAYAEASGKRKAAAAYFRELEGL